MQNFGLYATMLQQRGCSVEHRSATPIKVNDFLEDGDILTVAPNVTFFTEVMPNGCNIEFVLFSNQDGDLKRLYLGSLQKEIKDVDGKIHRTHGSFIEDLEEHESFTDFFAHKCGEQFKVTIKKVPVCDPFGNVREVNTYSFHTYRRKSKA